MCATAIGHEEKHEKRNQMAKSTKFVYSQLGDGHWYLVADAKDSTVEYAVFSLVDAPHAGKHMDLHFPENAVEKMLVAGKMSLLLDIYAFVFDTVLEITHNLKGVKLCKIHSHDEMTRLVYGKFADRLSERYEVKLYGKWMEILKK